MRLISTNVLQEEMIIARTIWNESGMPLLQEGMKVTPRIIQRLQQLNIQYVYIDDVISKGIEVKDSIPPKIRTQAVKHIETSFKELKKFKGTDITYCLEKSSKDFTNIINSLMDSIFNNEDMLTVLSDAFIYDEYIYQHSLQVAIYSISIAHEMHYNAEEVRQIGVGAMLHDVGKMLIPQEILQKPSRLSDEEYVTMQKHTQFGFDILRNLHTISLLSAHCAFQHHERLDGSGYPRGLVDFEIHPYAKIIAVADVFDAVTSKRVYRNKMLPSEGLDIIQQGSGTLYEKTVVDAFRRVIAAYPNGSVVLLSDGSRGIISKQEQRNTMRPHVRVFEKDGVVLKATYEVKLIESTLEIIKVDSEYLQQDITISPI